MPLSSSLHKLTDNIESKSPPELPAVSHILFILTFICLMLTDRMHAMSNRTCSPTYSSLILLKSSSDIMTEDEQTYQLLTQHLSISASFQRIEAVFDTINVAQSTGLGSDLIRLKKTWKDHRRQYVDLLWASHEVAGKVHAACVDFADISISFLSSGEVSLEEKRNYICNYFQKLEQDEQASKGLSDGFIELQESIISFKIEWKRTIEKYDQSNIANEIRSLDSQIQDIDRNISELDRKIDELGQRRSGLWGAVCGFFSWLFRPIMNGDSERDQAIQNRSGKINLRDIKRRERDDKANLLKGVQQLDATLTSVDSNFSDVCSKLGSFANIWAAIARDILQIEEKLSWANSTGNLKLFQSRLQTTASIYEVLGFSMTHFQAVMLSEVFSSRLDDCKAQLAEIKKQQEAAEDIQRRIDELKKDLREMGVEY
ncbi:hypothetical protein ABKN59_004596 [Abortiporus biennis]